MLAYLSAGSLVEAHSKDEFSFLLLLFIWFDCRLVMRVAWGLAVHFDYVYSCLIQSNDNALFKIA